MSNRLKKVLFEHRASLRLGQIFDSESSDSETDQLDEECNSDKVVTHEQEELVELIDNLNINTLSAPLQSNSNRIKMENIRFHTTLLPTFSGKQEHLESFILSVDEFFATYYNGTNEQKQLVTAAIKSKLVEDARNFCLSRPDLNNWNAIKTGLRQKFGDPVTYQILLQELQYIKINKYESLLQFVERIKTFVQRIIAKIQCEVLDQASKLTLLSQVENTAVLILTANSPQTLKTMLMIQRPNSLDAAFQHVINYNMIESQVNFTQINTVHHQRHQQNQNQQFNTNTQNRHTRPVHKPLFNPFAPGNQFTQPKQFPSQPINIQSRPNVNRHYPTNSQVFGRQPQFKPKFDTPTPMSTSTAGPSRLFQQRQPQRYNNFQPSGQRNFISQELTNLEVNPQFEDQVYYDNNTPNNCCFDNYPQMPNDEYIQDPNTEFEEIIDCQNQNFQEPENFQDVASDKELT